MFEAFTNWMFQAGTWNDVIVYLAVLAVGCVAGSIFLKD
jgi:hypothetical protein